MRKSVVIDEQAKKQLQESLTEVMTRFRNFFLRHMQPDHVPFRHRSDFAAPLVTVLGHTYGVRLVADSQIAPLGVEVSINVYDDEFSRDRFVTELTEAYQAENVQRLVENFMTPDDARLEKVGTGSLAKLFSFDVDRDVELGKKEKKEASKVTGRLEDKVLAVSYWLTEDGRKSLLDDRALFASVVHLYCLRVCVAAYRKSLTVGN